MMMMMREREILIKIDYFSLIGKLLLLFVFSPLFSLSLAISIVWIREILYLS
jgi:hypothetical protein